MTRAANRVTGLSLEKIDLNKGLLPRGKLKKVTTKTTAKSVVWIKYHNDGVTPRLKGEYDFGRPKGSFTKYYPNGKVQEEGVYDKGKYLGAMKRYYEDGTIMYARKL
jgi:antitoxin component YwqK of YwqJK toxin-antitoxin module